MGGEAKRWEPEAGSMNRKIIFFCVSGLCCVQDMVAASSCKKVHNFEPRICDILILRFELKV